MSEDPARYRTFTKDRYVSNWMPPADIIEAARKVADYMAMQTVGPWELAGVCSRDHANKAECYRIALEFIAHDVRCCSLDVATHVARGILK